ncbi:MAG: TetR/AcrR family transcriptional regulator [Sphaerochaetaceae bacterium]|nr:TetR/AcrR family transcriptional regulator [Sphaerochaetaceae bacterium]
MPPSIKFQKEFIIQAALNIARRKGIDAVTAREVAQEMKSSPRPIFSYYESMEQLRRDVFEAAKKCYRAYIEEGLAGPIPFLGVGQRYIEFAKKEPELYKLLFLTKPDGAVGGAMEALEYTQDLVRPSLMSIYNIDAHAADCYFRDLWLMSFSFATLIVTDDCPYSDEEMSAVFSEVSLSICKAYKEIPGLVEGNYDKDAIFRELVKK